MNGLKIKVISKNSNRGKQAISTKTVVPFQHFHKYVVNVITSSPSLTFCCVKLSVS